MRVTFPKLQDREPEYAVVERDDGVVYRVHGGLAGSGLPRDIRRLVVERSLGIDDGIWGGIVSGMVSTPRAEVLAGLAECVAGLDNPDNDQVRALAERALPREDIDPDAILAAARALRVEAARWARLRTGESLSYEWPAPGNRRAS